MHPVTHGNFALCVMKKVGRLLQHEYSKENEFNGLYKVKCVDVEYETNYRPNAETMGILVVLYDRKGREIDKDGIMYRYVGKVGDDYAEWDPIYVPPEEEIPEGYRHYVRTSGEFVKTSTEGEELMELISSYLGYGEYTEDVLLWLGNKILLYDNLQKMKVTVGSLHCPEFNIAEDLTRKLIGSDDFYVFIGSTHLT